MYKTFPNSGARNKINVNQNLNSATEMWRRQKKSDNNFMAINFDLFSIVSKDRAILTRLQQN